MSPTASPKIDESCKDAACSCTPAPTLQPFAQTPLTASAACCGSSPAAPSDTHARAGYAACHFVERFMDTPAGPVPVVRTANGWRDRLGTLGARSGINRHDYSVAPGLYAIGSPDPASPVLVTANFKLTFDTLRARLSGTDAWLLVLDTLGVNVWCAAGKGTFATNELIHRIDTSRLASVVSHRTLVVPQLGATGVSAVAVKKHAGFSVVWGPVRAEDIQGFIRAGMKADTAMRMVTFTTAERLVLIPVELSIVFKYLIWVMLGAAVISGIGPSIFSFEQAAYRGAILSSACLGGVIAGCILSPALLPWIPGTAFAAKGALMGGLTGIVISAMVRTGLMEAGLMVLCAMALSSFLAMNFTGATPFTSPSGVEREMRRSIPLQLAATVIVVLGWVGAAFV